MKQFSITVNFQVSAMLIPAIQNFPLPPVFSAVHLLLTGPTLQLVPVRSVIPTIPVLLTLTAPILMMRTIDHV